MPPRVTKLAEANKLLCRLSSINYGEIDVQTSEKYDITRDDCKSNGRENAKILPDFLESHFIKCAHLTLDPLFRNSVSSCSGNSLGSPANIKEAKKEMPRFMLEGHERARSIVLRSYIIENAGIG